MPHDSLRRIIEALMAEDPVECGDGDAWVRELLGALDAREYSTMAEDCSARVSRESGKDVEDRVLMKKLEAAREAQRALGKLNIS